MVKIDRRKSERAVQEAAERAETWAELNRLLKSEGALAAKRKKPKAVVAVAVTVAQQDKANESQEGEEGADDDDGVIRCLCGSQGSFISLSLDVWHYSDVYIFQKETHGTMVQCESCSVWQHTSCMGLSVKRLPREYLCELCRSTVSTEGTMSLVQNSRSVAPATPPKKLQPVHSKKPRRTYTSLAAAQSLSDILPLLDPASELFQSLSSPGRSKKSDMEETESVSGAPSLIEQTQESTVSSSKDIETITVTSSVDDISPPSIDEHVTGKPEHMNDLETPPIEMEDDPAEEDRKMMDFEQEVEEDKREESLESQQESVTRNALSSLLRQVEAMQDHVRFWQAREDCPSLDALQSQLASFNERFSPSLFPGHQGIS